MRVLKTILSVALFMLALTQIASAQEGKPGEVWVSLKGADYTKPFEGTDEWTEHEFEENGFKLVIRIPDVSVVHTFDLRPSDDSLGTVSITTEPKKFKPARVKGEKLPRLVFKATAKFVAKPKDAPPSPAPEPAPAP